jgi:serine/threonine-protein phosphatase 2A regulatory subunit A
VVLAFLGVLPSIVVSSGSILLSAALAESVLAADLPATASALLDVVGQSSSDPTLMPFVSYLVQSAYDSVRRFVPSVLRFLCSDDERLSIIQHLVTIGSPFKVRYAVVKAIPSFYDHLALQVTTTLQADPVGRIRAALPVVSSARPFWLGPLAMKFAADHDWAVRASLASSLVSCQDTGGAIVLASRLLSDGVWQVKLCSLRSLTNLLSRLSVDVGVGEGLRKTLSDIRLGYQIPTLKKAVVDVFLALFKRGRHPEDDSLVLDFITKEGPEVQLHFLTSAVAVGSPDLLRVVAGQLVSVVGKLAANEFWRTRLGVVELLTELVRLSGSADAPPEFARLCLRLISDESWDVREAAARQLVNLDDMTFADGELPAVIRQLAKSQTFRERQAALLIIRTLLRQEQTDGNRRALRKELEKFAGATECPNIVSLAAAVLNDVSG